MRLKKLALALAAVCAFAAMIANDAVATATESNGFWYEESVKLSPGEHLPVICSQVGEFTITTTVGTSNTPLKLRGGLSCPLTVLFNESSKAKATGKFQLAPISVVEPVGCTVVGSEVETEPLKAQVYMEGTKALMRFAPASGTIIAEPEISGCAIANAYPIKGVVFGEFVNLTNVVAGAQNLKFSSAINSFAGGELLFGGHSAAINGEIKVSSSITVKVGGKEVTRDSPFKVNES